MFVKGSNGHIHPALTNIPVHMSVYKKTDSFTQKKATNILKNCPLFKNLVMLSFYNTHLVWNVWCLMKLFLQGGCSPTWRFHETTSSIFHFVASRSPHFDRVVGSLCCFLSGYDILLSRCQESGSRVVLGNIKQSNPPPETMKEYSLNPWIHFIFMCQHISQRV